MKNRDVMGMVLFIASEAIFFLLLLLSYVNYHRTGGSGITAASMLDPLKTGIFSVALFTSSFTLWLSEVARKKGRIGAGIWLSITILLGTIFLAGQGFEYAHLLKQNVTISRDLFGSTFFTLTGFHGLHVFVGLIMLSMLLGLVMLGRKTEPTLSSIKAISVYWHFVDAVWLVVFSVVYLWRYA